MPKVKTTDTGFPKHIRKAINDAKGVRVDVGYFQEDKSSDGKTFLAEQAAYNEFGAPRANIAERSFMRSTVDENDKAYEKDIANIFNDVQSGKHTLIEGLSKFGQWVRDDIVQKIIAIRSPGNKPSTIKAKGYDNPLIQTSHMANSTKYKVGK